MISRGLRLTNHAGWITTRVGRAVTVFLLCMCAAFVCALAFAILVSVDLSTADFANGESIMQKLSDPFVYNSVILGGTFFGLVSFPFVYFATRVRRLRSTAPAIFGVVFGEIVVVTPLLRMANLFGAPIALAVALILCASGTFDSGQNPATGPRGIGKPS